MKLAPKIILALLMVLLIFGLIIGILGFKTIKNVALETAGSNGVAITQQTLDKIDRVLFERSLNIQAIAANEIFSRVLSQNVSVSIADLYLEREMLTSGPWEKLDIVDKNGIIVLSTNTSNIGKKTTYSADFFSSYVSNNLSNIYNSDIKPLGENGRPVMVFSGPIYNLQLSDKPIIGAVVAEFSWQTIDEIVSETGNNYRANLYNKDGLLIKTNVHNSSGVVEFVTNYQKSLDIVKALQEEVGYTITSSSTGSEKSAQVMSFAHEEGYLNYKGNNWIMTVESPVSKIMVPYQTQVETILVVVAITTILALILLYSFIFGIAVNPILRLKNAINVFEDTQQPASLKILSDDEIGEVTNNFNLMTKNVLDRTADLRKLQSSLESTVEERTKALKVKLEEIEKMNNLMVDREMKMIELKKEIAELRGK